MSVKGIKIEINGEDFDLTIESAEKLHHDLHVFFNKGSPIQPCTPISPQFPAVPVCPDFLFYKVTC